MTVHYDGRMGNLGSGIVTNWHGNLKVSKWSVAVGVLITVWVCLGVGAARALTINSTVQEDNGATVSTGHEPNQALFTGGVAGMGNGVVTTTGGYDFTQTMYMTLTNITSISVTLTIQDGNSGNVVGSNPPTPDFDYNHLRLALDGTDTGLILNGFRGNGLQDTFTFTGTPLNATTILASLKADGKLVGTITTDNPNDTAASPNEVYIGNDAGNATTALSITGAVPEPGTWACLAVSLLSLVGVRRSRRA